MTFSVETSNVISTKTGTGWTLDVTDLNLASDTTIKDVVLLTGTPLVQVEDADVSKLTATTIQYTGDSLPTDTAVEARRSSPKSQYNIIVYAERFSSSDFNREIQRIYRVLNEFIASGIDGLKGLEGGIINEVFGAGWGSDVNNAPSRASLFTKITDMVTDIASNLSATGTNATDIAGNVTAISNEATARENADNALDSAKADIAGDTFTGVVSGLTAADTDASTKFATTAHVANRINATLLPSIFVQQSTVDQLIGSTWASLSTNSQDGEFIQVPGATNPNITLVDNEPGTVRLAVGTYRVTCSGTATVSPASTITTFQLRVAEVGGIGDTSTPNIVQSLARGISQTTMFVEWFVIVTSGTRDIRPEVFFTASSGGCSFRDVSLSVQPMQVF